MPWKTLPTTAKLLEWGGVLLLAVWGIYKKELQDYFKACFKRFYSYLAHRQSARRLTESELQVILDSGLEGLETFLWLLLKEYDADRVTVTEYTETEDGGAFATCLVEVRNVEMKSVRNLKQTPLPPPLWAEIKRIGTRYPDRVRYVPDARVEENAAVRAALFSSAVCSAYYEMMPDPSQEYTNCRLLAVSWHAEHQLSAEQRAALHRSGVACATVLSLMEQLKRTSKD